MSRSKHTRPNKIRAADRVREPRKARGADDLSALKKKARELKESGSVLDLSALEAAVTGSPVSSDPSVNLSPGARSARWPSLAAMGPQRCSLESVRHPEELEAGPSVELKSGGASACSADLDAGRGMASPLQIIEQGQIAAGATPCVAQPKSDPMEADPITVGETPCVAQSDLGSDGLEDSGSVILPRVIVKRPRKGYLHPATKSDIIEVLQFFGEHCFYGLKTIKLLQGSDSFAGGSILLGRLEVPGTIVLYDLAESPWVINQTLPDWQQQRLQAAGAQIELLAAGAQTRIDWCEPDLKNFYLFDVFMHEIGHHLIQQYKGKRNLRVARTKDHEHYATLFANRCRQQFLQE